MEAHYYFLAQQVRDFLTQKDAEIFKLSSQADWTVAILLLLVYQNNLGEPQVRSCHNNLRKLEETWIHYPITGNTLHRPPVSVRHNFKMFKYFHLFRGFQNLRCRAPKLTFIKLLAPIWSDFRDPDRRALCQGPGYFVEIYFSIINYIYLTFWCLKRLSAILRQVIPVLVLSLIILSNASPFYFCWSNKSTKEVSSWLVHYPLRTIFFWMFPNGVRKKLLSVLTHLNCGKPSALINFILWPCLFMFPDFKSLILTLVSPIFSSLIVFVVFSFFKLVLIFSFNIFTMVL